MAALRFLGMAGLFIAQQAMAAAEDAGSDESRPHSDDLDQNTAAGQDVGSSSDDIPTNSNALVFEGSCCCLVSFVLGRFSCFGLCADEGGGGVRQYCVPSSWLLEASRCSACWYAARRFA